MATSTPMMASRNKGGKTMAHYMVTVQKVLTGVQLIEADTLDEAFEIAENNEEGWTWQDPDMAFINYDMMSANVM